MKKITLGQTIQLLANVAVLASVLLLAYELRQSRRLAQSEFEAEIRNSMQSIDQTMMGSDPAEVWTRAIEDPAALSAADIKVMDTYLFLWLNNWYQKWLLEQAGLIDSGRTLQTIKDAAGILFANDFAQVWWQVEKGWNDPAFVELVDEALAAAGTSGSRQRLQQIQHKLAEIRDEN